MNKSFRIINSLKHHLEVSDHNYISIMDLIPKKELIKEIEVLIKENETLKALVGTKDDTDS